MVHGDPHPGNALRVPSPRPGAAVGYVLIDPSSLLAEPAYDLGVVLRDWCPQLLADGAVALARRYCRRLAGRTGVEEAVSKLLVVTSRQRQFPTLVGCSRETRSPRPN